jgi:hypothetical protein
LPDPREKKRQTRRKRMNEEEKRGCLAWPPTSRSRKRMEVKEMVIRKERKAAWQFADLLSPS